MSRMELMLAWLLEYGTWLASGLIAVGLVMSTRATIYGIALFILLPVLRVVLMLAVFLRERDYRFATIAGTVLVIILIGTIAGSRAPQP
jgi:uncharacterized membrane protein